MKEPFVNGEICIYAMEIQHKKRYGYRRITQELHNKGIIINHKTVNKLLYLSPLLDMYNGEIISYTIDYSPRLTISNGYAE